MAYRVALTRAAAKALARIEERDRRRIVAALALLRDTPKPPKAKKLSGREELWRVRVGDYRLVYAIEENRLVVLVLRIGHRREVYRK